MGLFTSAEELARRENLKKLEDKRVEFAQSLARQGFAPEKMLFLLRDDGGFGALCRFQGRSWLILSPALGSDRDFALIPFAPGDVVRREVNRPAEGMGGILGMGKRPEYGAEYHIALPEGGEASLCAVSGRGCWAEFRLARNPLIKTQRRRGDANVAWELKPIERTALNGLLAEADEMTGLA